MFKVGILPVFKPKLMSFKLCLSEIINILNDHFPLILVLARKSKRNFFLDNTSVLRLVIIPNMSP